MGQIVDLMDTRSNRNWQRIIDLLVADRLCLFVGAGLSCRAGIPDWSQLLREFSNGYKLQQGHSEKRAAEVDRLAEARNLELFELMKNDTAGEIALIEVLKKYFHNERCDILHKNLLQLPFRGFITTNYDKCFENACRMYRVNLDFLGERWFCFPPYQELQVSTEEIFDGEKFFLHMHGCFCRDGGFEVNNIVLTRSQYLKFYHQREMHDILQYLSKRHVLMLTTSFTDEYFLDGLREFRQPEDPNERANMPEWYMLCDFDPEKWFPIRDEENFGIHHIYYENGNDGLASIIRKMTNEIDLIKHPVSKVLDPGKVDSVG